MLLGLDFVFQPCQFLFQLPYFFLFSRFDKGLRNLSDRFRFDFAGLPVQEQGRRRRHAVLVREEARYIRDADAVITVSEPIATTLAARYAKVIWVPGNHELWTHPSDPVQLRGEERYRYLVDLVRGLGVVTPEDDYPIWPYDGEPVVVVPLFLLYDYTFLAPGTSSREQSLELAHENGIVCVDEFLLHPDPHPGREAWCRARVAATRRRLDALDPALPLVLVNHFPLVREPTAVLRHPEFAQWCGTVQTADWHRRYRCRVAVYGHLHIPRTTTYDGVPFVEVSLGYPAEWAAVGGPLGPRQILPRRSSR